MWRHTYDHIRREIAVYDKNTLVLKMQGPMPQSTLDQVLSIPDMVGVLSQMLDGKTKWKDIKESAFSTLKAMGLADIEKTHEESRDENEPAPILSDDEMVSRWRNEVSDRYIANTDASHAIVGVIRAFLRVIDRLQAGQDKTNDDGHFEKIVQWVCSELERAFATNIEPGREAVEVESQLRVLVNAYLNKPKLATQSKRSVKEVIETPLPGDLMRIGWQTGKHSYYRVMGIMEGFVICEILGNNPVIFSKAQWKALLEELFTFRLLYDGNNDIPF